jgi:hypothetical protein
MRAHRNARNSAEQSTRGYLFTSLTAGARPGSVEVFGRDALFAAVHWRFGETHSWHASLPSTVAWRGSRGVCPARSSAALLADHDRFEAPGEHRGTCDHRDGSPFEVSDDDHVWVGPPHGLEHAVWEPVRVTHPEVPLAGIGAELDVGDRAQRGRLPELFGVDRW